MLLLDEPSNQLDLIALRWLGDHLTTATASSPTRTTLVVSHDAAFLSAVSTDTLSLEGGGILHVPGPYDSLVAMHEQRARHDRSVLAAAEAKEAKLQSSRRQQERVERAHAQSTTHRIERDPARRARRVGADRVQAKLANKPSAGADLPLPILQSARCGWSSEKRSAAEVKETVQARQAAHEHATQPWRIDSAPPAGCAELVRVDGATLARCGTDGGERAILEGATLQVGARSRVAIVGANGVGKTTLLEALLATSASGADEEASLEGGQTEQRASSAAAAVGGCASQRASAATGASASPSSRRIISRRCGRRTHERAVCVRARELQRAACAPPPWRSRPGRQPAGTSNRR